MSAINVALLQMSSCGTDQEASLAKGEAFCWRAREMGADVALFLEMWNIGYTFDRSAREGAPNHRSEDRVLRTSGGHRSCGKPGTKFSTQRCRARSRCGKRRR
jgi:predicted amidohydrolase